MVNKCKNYQNGRKLPKWLKIVKNEKECQNCHTQKRVFLHGFHKICTFHGQFCLPTLPPTQYPSPNTISKNQNGLGHGLQIICVHFAWSILPHNATTQ